MFSRIVVAVQHMSQPALDLVHQLATEGVTEVQVLHLRERELSGSTWYSRETGNEAAYLADAAAFELRMAGIAAGGNVRPAIVDRVAEAILARRRSSGPTSSSWAGRAAGRWPPGCSAASPSGCCAGRAAR